MITQQQVAAAMKYAQQLQDEYAKHQEGITGQADYDEVLILVELCREQHGLIEQVRDWRGLDGDGISDTLRAQLLAVLRLFEEVKSDE